MPLVARLEWRLARRRSRLFTLNVAIPLLLVGPVALSAAPAAHAAAVYAVLFTLFGTFGSAIPLVRDGETGILARVVLTGISPRRLVVERIITQTAIDTVQLLPALLVIVAATGPGVALAAALPAVLFGALLTANAFGVWIAALARSIAEAALFAAVVMLFALHGGGVFRTPAPGTLAAAFERLIPFRYLHEALLAASTGAAGGLTAASTPTSLTAAPSITLLLVGSILGGAAALALSAAAAPGLAGRLARTPLAWRSP